MFLLPILSLFLPTTFALIIPANTSSTTLLSKRANAKRGIAFAQPNGNDVHHFAGGAATWLYSWQADPPEHLTQGRTGLEYVPMLWGEKSVDGFQNVIERLRPRYVLGFNEPERGDQANLSVGQAIDLWRRHMEPLKSKYPGIQLGAPGVSAAPEGPAWLRGFMDGCTGCSIDFIPIHWYGDGAQWFLEYVEKMRRDFGKKLWVTEYASTNGDDGAVTQFMIDTMSALNDMPNVERYSWFAWTRPDGKYGPNNFHMLNGDGSLHQRGRLYLEK